MTFLVVSADRDGLAAAADSWTYQGDDVEHEGQTKVATVFDCFVVGVAGAEYIIDLDRYDFGEVIAGRAVDRWFPDRPREAYRRHHHAGESSIIEIVKRWESLQDPAFVKSVQRSPDVEAFHHGVSQLLERVYADERHQARITASRGGSVELATYDQMHLVTLGYGAASAGVPRDEALPSNTAAVKARTGQIWRSTFALTQETCDVSVGRLELSTADFAPLEVFATDLFNDTEWWVGAFGPFYDQARTATDPRPLAAATLLTAEHAIACQPPQRHPYGGTPHGAHVSRLGAVTMTLA